MKQQVITLAQNVNFFKIKIKDSDYIALDPTSSTGNLFDSNKTITPLNLLVNKEKLITNCIFVSTSVIYNSTLLKIKYFFHLRRTSAPKANRPEPNNQTAPGSGTADIIPSKCICTLVPA